MPDNNSHDLTPYLQYCELDTKLQGSHSELTKEQQKCRELERLLSNYKNVITELQDDVDQTNKQNKESAINVSDQYLILIYCIIAKFLFKDYPKTNA